MTEIEGGDPESDGPDPDEASERPNGVSDLEPIDVGEETNAAEDHDRIAYGN